MKKYRDIFIGMLALLLTSFLLSACADKDIEASDGSETDSESVYETETELEGNEFAKDNVAYYDEAWKR